MECPLCRQAFSAILYDIKSEYEFREYKLGMPVVWLVRQHSLCVTEANSNFLSIRESPANRPLLASPTEDLLKDKWGPGTSHSAALNSPFFSRIFAFGLRNPYYEANALANQMANRVIQSGTVDHRRYIYSSEMYCLPGGSGDTSRRRPSNPRFYRENEASTHRLIPFLNLELRALIHNANERSLLMQVIMNSLTSSSIASSKFQQLISQYTLHRTIHFIHEFYNFAISVHETTERYFERAIYVPRNQVQVVQIRYEYDEQPFDLSDPYNYRISQGVYNDINNNVSPYGSGASTAIARAGGSVRTASSASSIGSARSSGTSTVLSIPTNHVRRTVELNAASSSSSSSSESDDDVIFEGITKATAGTSTARRTGYNRLLNQANESDAAQSSSGVSASAAEDHTDPKPGPSGLSNNRINLTLNQLRTQYTDDSDSDYDSDNYLGRNNPSTGLRFFESDDDDEEQRKLDELKRGLEDSSDDDNSIEYVGYVKPRHLRTPELIEILTSDEESEYSAGAGSLKIKRLKTEQRENSQTAAGAEKSIKCKCKIRCKVQCKRASV